MEEKISRVADRLYKDQPKIERGGYCLSSWDDFYNIVEQWVEVHDDWTIDQLYRGIKYYNYLFPYNVSIDMVLNTENW